MISATTHFSPYDVTFLLKAATTSLWHRRCAAVVGEYWILRDTRPRGALAFREAINKMRENDIQFHAGGALTADLVAWDIRLSWRIAGQHTTCRVQIKNRKIPANPTIGTLCGLCVKIRRVASVAYIQNPCVHCSDPIHGHRECEKSRNSHRKTRVYAMWLEHTSTMANVYMRQDTLWNEEQTWSN